MEENNVKIVTHFWNLAKKHLPNGTYEEVKAKALELFKQYEMDNYDKVHGKHSIFDYTFDRILMPRMYEAFQKAKGKDCKEIEDKLNKMQEAYSKMKEYLTGLQDAYNKLKNDKERI